MISERKMGWNLLSMICIVYLAKTGVSNRVTSLCENSMTLTEEKLIWKLFIQTTHADIDDGRLKVNAEIKHINANKCVASGANSCQDGWESFKDKCFLFSEDQKSWSDAKSHCKSLGAQLAELKDFDTNEFAKHFLNLKYLFHNEQTRHNFFIGLSDQDQTNVWKWAGSGETADFTDWTSGEPSGGTEHCTVLWGYIGYWWNDEECQKQFQYICEADNTLPVVGK